MHGVTWQGQPEESNDKHFGRRSWLPQGFAAKLVLPQRACCSQRGAMLVQHMRAPEQAQGSTSPKKNKCDKQVSSWRHISCHTDKNRYYT